MSGSEKFQGNDAMGSNGEAANAGSMGRELSFNPSISTQLQSVPANPLAEDCYNMAHPNRGKCVIFNNRVFERHTHLPERLGSDKDEESLINQFEKLGFLVIVHRDLTHRKLCAKLKEFGEQDYSQDDCFVCCILTHGGDGYLYGSDGKFPVEQVFKPFLGSACPTLESKPKLFFIQACRGTQLDDGVKVTFDTADSSLGTGPIVTDPDFLVAYSTVEGFYSWRNEQQGTWFVQALCGVLSKRGQSDHHLLSVLTEVCREVAFKCTSDTPRNPRFHKKKQVPSITCTLTRLLYFF